MDDNIDARDLRFDIPFKESLEDELSAALMGLLVHHEESIERGDVANLFEHQKRIEESLKHLKDR